MCHLYISQLSSNCPSSRLKRFFFAS
ncbi:Protein CBG27693 [Caenorhabditis briggsae]|uniref:Protein CBG27693 n=1 Tax=Caenorhabditis briggsae TaxID=6238 RepID=B6IJD8_CAEBR|nr:Protein CBG27693 [Caenorhabditis briggsae]CAR99972.1 Protein CBG27693 [Caenorhabditis briggsae]